MKRVMKQWRNLERQSDRHRKSNVRESDWHHGTRLLEIDCRS